MTIKQQGGIFGRNPTFNDLTVEGALSVPSDSISGDAIDGGTATLSGLTVDTNTIYVDAANHRLGVGTSTPGTKVEMYATAGTSSDLVIRLRATDGAAAYGSVVDLTTTATGPQVADLIISTRDGSNITETLRCKGNGDVSVNRGNLIIGTSGNGIDFSATSGTGTSELFDDYEEGSWTPAFTPTGTDFSSITYDTQSGHYTKVGRLVTATGFIRTDAITVGSASGSVLISGLPYAATSAAVGSVGGTYNWGMVGDVPLSVTIFNASTELYMYYRTSVNGIDSAIAPSDMGTGANNNDIYFTISYMAS